MQFYYVDHYTDLHSNNWPKKDNGIERCDYWMHEWNYRCKHYDSNIFATILDAEEERTKSKHFTRKNFKFYYTDETIKVETAVCYYCCFTLLISLAFHFIIISIQLQSCELCTRAHSAVLFFLLILNSCHFTTKFLNSFSDNEKCTAFRNTNLNSCHFYDNKKCTAFHNTNHNSWHFSEREMHRISQHNS